MNDIQDLVKTGWVIPKKIKEDFVEFCTENSTIVQEACAGALVIFQLLPVQLRSLAMLEAKGKGVVDRKFWKDYREGLEAAIRDQCRLYNQSARPKKQT